VLNPWGQFEFFAYWFFLLILIIPLFESIMSEERKMYPCTCSDCGKESEVPFQPKEGRPVYCRECLPKHRSKRF